ncbi:Efflux pump radE [Fusarium oxysporum f. sp. albedinis]|nr:Efflux pump radE [Fusarium oxysporum f. sp. albedinis]
MAMLCEGNPALALHSFHKCPSPPHFQLLVTMRGHSQLKCTEQEVLLPPPKLCGGINTSRSHYYKSKSMFCGSPYISIPGGGEKDLEEKEQRQKEGRAPGDSIDPQVRVARHSSNDCGRSASAPDISSKPLSLHPLCIQTPSFDAFFRLILLLADPSP